MSDMSDQEFEYVDEDGTPIDPAELGDDYEVVEEIVEEEPTAEAPAAQQPAAEVPAGKAPRLLIAGAAAVVLLVVGGVAFGLSQIGNQSTVSDVKDAAREKKAAVSSSVAAKSSEVREEAIDTCETRGPGSLADAMADSGSDTPRLRLDVIAAEPLPGAFTAARTNSDGVKGDLSLLQLSKSRWGVYVKAPLTKAEKRERADRPGYWKADVTVTGDAIRVTGDRAWAGGDTGGAGSCEPGDPGVYAATGKIPADAQGLVDGSASVEAIRGVAGEPTYAVAVMGDSVALVGLVEAPAEGGEGGESSESSAPKK